MALLLTQTAPEGLVPPAAQCPGPPDYPTSENASGVAGRVVISVTLDEAGVVTKLEIATGLSAAFDTAALESAKKCTFTPALMNGKAVPSIVQLTADFVPPLRPWTLEGDVVGELGEVVPGAKVELGEKSTLTDENGHFSLTFEGLPAGDSWVLVTKAGHADKAFPETFKSGLTTRVRYALPNEKVYETRVSGSRLLPAVPDADKTPQVSKFVITRADMDRSPGAYEDVARIAQQAPGVAADPDILGTLFVRGGGPEEVIFYLDGVPLSNPYHLGGFVSIFNPMMLDTAEFYTGGVPARYEPALSGALEVHHAVPDTKKLRVLVDVSMQSAMARVDIPLGIEGLSMIVSARRTYLEAYFAVLRAFKVVSNSFVAPEVTELLARVNYRRGNHQTTATYLYARDGVSVSVNPGEEVLFNFSGNLNLSNQLHLASLQHRIDFGGDSKVTITGAYTHDINESTASASVYNYENRAKTDDALVRIDGVLAGSATNRTQAGLQYAHRQSSLDGIISDPRAQAPWVSMPSVSLYTDDYRFSPAVVRDLFSVYAEHTYRPVEPLVLEAGGRAQVDARNGQFTGSGRVAFAWTLPTATVFKVSAGVALQPVLAAPVLTENPNLLPERSFQVVAGIEQPLPIEALLRLEVWGKYLDQLVVNPDTLEGFSALKAKNQPAFQNGGTGFARGVDLLFVGRTRYLSYGLSMGLLFSDRTNPLAAGAKTYATPWDQRFTSALSLSWSPNDKWMVTGKVSVRTGRPYTPISGFTWDDARRVYVPSFEATNSARYPAFYEISLRGERRFTIGPVKLAVYAELLNITNSTNVFTYLYDNGPVEMGAPQPDEPARNQINHLPFRPFLGLRSEY